MSVKDHKSVQLTAILHTQILLMPCFSSGNYLSACEYLDSYETGIFFKNQYLKKTNES